MEIHSGWPAIVAHERTKARPFLVDVVLRLSYDAGCLEFPGSFEVRAANRHHIACVVSWAKDGAVTSVVEHGRGTTRRVGRAWFLAPWVCLSLAALALWSDSAVAGCGDYVIFRPQASAISLTAQHLSGTSAGLFLPAEAPCNTPLCRGNRPADPVPTPPTPQQIDQRPLVLLARAAEVECPFLAGSGWPRLHETPLDGFLQSLLRPPCA